MPGLTIGWEYLTGYAVATDPSNRKRAEWPPHPARVFMAMAAAFFETGEDSGEADALRWIETLGDPQMYLPSVEPENQRSMVTVYVPVNDTTPVDFSKNKIYKEIVATSKSDITPSKVESWIKAIDKSAINAIVIPTCLRIYLLPESVTSWVAGLCFGLDFSRPIGCYASGESFTQQVRCIGWSRSSLRSRSRMRFWSPARGWRWSEGC